MQFTDVDDLTDVIGVVGADVGDSVSPLRELVVAGGFDQVLEIGEDSVELLGG